MGYDVERTKKVQEKALYIAKIIHNICEKNNIKYYLDAGSVLGAIRHDGFIPWDDDLDIEMLREDYDRFMQIAPSELPEDLYLQTPENEKQYHCTFAKVRMKNTLFEEEYNCGKDYPRGIYVDIFPVDNLRKPDFIFSIKNGIKKLFKSLYFLKERTDKLGFIQKLVKMLTFFIPKKFCYKMVNKMIIYKKDADYRFESLSSYNVKRVVFPKEVFGKPTLHKFEDTEFYIPEDAHEYLRIKYGDYMKLPPENERGMHHHILRIDFNYDDSKYFK